MNRITIKTWSTLALAALLAATDGALGTTVTLTSVADTDIEQFHADSNFGKGTSMVSGELGASANNELRRALLRFDLAGQVPPGAVINSASLQVVVVREPIQPANSSFGLRRLLQAWDETAATWNSRVASVPWQVPGAEGASDSASGASASVFVTGLGVYTFAATPALVADVQGWANDPSSNFGWLLVSEGEGTPYTARRFGTREDPTHVPKLIVDYSLPAPVVQTQPRSQTVQVDGTAVFNVTASGSPPLAYQWLFFGNAISGATSNVLVLPNVQTNDAGDYAVVVSNPYGSTTSQVATLTVSPLPLPQVLLTSPTNGSEIAFQSQLLVSAEAAETNGVITELQLLLDGALLADSTNSLVSVLLTNTAPGNHLLTAIATDEFGTSGSNSVAFTVFPPPLVRLIEPAANAAFPLGTNVILAANVDPGSADITNVLFLANGQGIGQSSNAPFSIQWGPAQAQAYSLVAVAFDVLGQSATSAVVNVRIFIPEQTTPTLKITHAPPDFARLSSASVVLAGTAADNVGVDRVEVQVNNSPFVPAQGTDSWEAEITLAAGNNTVRVRSVDLAGNTSAVATRFFTYLVRAPLSLRANGAGTVTPNLNGRLLDIGNTFSVTARPSPGNIFAGWTGVLNSNRPALNFVMASNLVLVANFVPNPFAALAGTYTGLFLDTNQFTLEGAGLVTLHLASHGDFSGRLTMNGASYPFHGQFSPAGTVTFPVLRRTQTPVVLSLQLDLSADTGNLSGFATNALGKEVLVSPVSAHRNPFTLAQPAPQRGIRAFVLQPLEAGATPGRGEAFIGSSGAVQLLGALPDGTRFLLASALAGDGTVPVYTSLRSGSVLLFGFLSFPSAPPGALSGALFWFESTHGVTQVLTAAPAGP